MADEAQLEQVILQAQEAVQVQGDTVRSLKAQLKDGKAEKVGNPGQNSPIQPLKLRAHHSPRLSCIAQAEVDQAIKKLSELKLELGEAQKVSAHIGCNRNSIHCCLFPRPVPFVTLSISGLKPRWMVAKHPSHSCFLKKAFNILHSTIHLAHARLHRHAMAAVAYQRQCTFPTLFAANAWHACRLDCSN